MPGAASISWVFPTDKLWFVVNSFLPMVEDPMMLVLGLAIIFGLGAVVVNGSRMMGGDVDMLDNIKPIEDVRVPDYLYPSPVYPAWSLDAYVPVSFRRFGRVSGHNSHQDNAFNTNKTQTLRERIVQFIEIALWERLSPLRPLRLLNVFGARFSPYLRDSWFGDLLYPSSWVRPKDFDDPLDYLEAKGVFNRQSFVNGQYVDPETMYSRMLADLQPDLQRKFLDVKPHLSEYYKGQLNDYQLLETFVGRVRKIDRDLPASSSSPSAPKRAKRRSNSNQGEE